MLIDTDGNRHDAENPVPVTVMSTIQEGMAPHISNVSVATTPTAFPTTTPPEVRGQTAVRNGGIVTVTLTNADGSGVFELLPKDAIVYPAGGPATLGYASVASGTADLQILEMR